MDDTSHLPTRQEFERASANVQWLVGVPFLLHCQNARHDQRDKQRFLELAESADRIALECDPIISPYRWEFFQGAEKGVAGIFGQDVPAHFWTLEDFFGLRNAVWTAIDPNQYVASVRTAERFDWSLAVDQWNKTQEALNSLLVLEIDGMRAVVNLIKNERAAALRLGEFRPPNNGALQSRRDLFLRWHDEGMTPAEIRDRWNALDNDERLRYDKPGKIEGTSQKTLGLVKTTLSRAKSRRK